jgi:hypothetical protein
MPACLLSGLPVAGGIAEPGFLHVTHHNSTHNQHIVVCLPACFSGLPIAGRIVEPGFLEGGDFFPMGQDLALVGVGLRSNVEACQQLMDKDLLGTRRLGVVRDDFDRDQVGCWVVAGVYLFASVYVFAGVCCCLNIYRCKNTVANLCECCWPFGVVCRTACTCIACSVCWVRAVWVEWEGGGEEGQEIPRSWLLRPTGPGRWPAEEAARVMVAAANSTPP